MTRGFPVLLALVLAIGIAALDVETDGFRVVTTAGARQLSLERAPQPLPDATLVDQDGKSFSLHDYKGRPVLVDFIYTRCPTVCSALGADFEGVRRLPNPARRPQIDLLSISFDPADDSAALRLYAGRFGADPPHWRIATPADPRELASLLRSFGVVVIPDGNGGFVHSDTVYLVDAHGRLAAILNQREPAGLVAAAFKVVAR